MNRQFIDELLKAAREIAPEIEAAVAGIKDSDIRCAMAGAIMRRVLAEVRSTGLPASAYSAGLSMGPGGAQRRETGRGTRGRILGLLAEDFFAEPQRLEQVLEELRVKGYHHSKSDVRMSLLRLARQKLLRRIPFGTGRQRMFLYVNP